MSGGIVGFGNEEVILWFLWSWLVKIDDRDKLLLVLVEEAVSEADDLETWLELGNWVSGWVLNDCRNVADLVTLGAGVVQVSDNGDVDV